MIFQKEGVHSIKRQIRRIKNDILFLNSIKGYATEGYTCGLGVAVGRSYEGNVHEFMEMLKEEFVIKKIGPLNKIKDLHVKEACRDGHPQEKKPSIQSSQTAWWVDKKKLDSLLIKKSNELSRLETHTTRGALQ